MNTKVKVSDYIAEFIAELGVKNVFMISGGGNMHLVDSISRRKDFEYICTHHEQSAAIAAEAYGRESGNIGVCVVTTGPAGTNCFTGVAGAWLDSIPTLYISGQVKRETIARQPGLRQLGVQEAPIVEMVKPITKYAVLIEDPELIRYHLEKAVYFAKNGRPGPVWLDIPTDVQGTFIDPSVLKSFDAKVEGIILNPQHSLTPELLETISNLLNNAKRPVIFAGHGIRLANARSEFLDLINYLQIPVLTAMSAHDLIETDHPLFAGRPGVFGDRAGNFAIQNADVLLSIGARHHLWNIGYNTPAFARGAKKIIVDIDEAELKKPTVMPDIPVHAHAKDFLIWLKENFKNASLQDIDPWRAKTQEWKLKYPVVLAEYKDDKNFVNSYYFTDTLSRMVDEGEVIFTGVGTSFTGTLQCFRIKKGVHLHSNVGCAAMGYCLPASIGGCFARDRKRTVLITGEGSLMMNIQELQTIRHYNLPIKIFLLNNKGYLAIKNTQNSFFAGNLAAVDSASGVSFPDFKKIANAFDLPYLYIEHSNQVEQGIRDTLGQEGPVVCEINMSPTQPLLPKVYSEKLPDGTMISKPLEDMFPFLPREEFEANMYIKAIN